MFDFCTLNLASLDLKQLDQEIDLTLIRDNLKLSYEERIAQHQNTLDFIDELQKTKAQHDAKPSSSAQAIGS